MELLSARDPVGPSPGARLGHGEYRPGRPKTRPSQRLPMTIQQRSRVGVGVRVRVRVWGRVRVRVGVSVRVGV